MKNKRWYLIFGIGIVVIVGLFFGIKQINSRSLDGTYYEYSDYDNDPRYWEELKVVIKDDKLIQTTETAGDLVWDLDEKNKTMTYAGVESTTYTVKDDIFSFNDRHYVKKDSETFKSAKKYEETSTPDKYLLK